MTTRGAGPPLARGLACSLCLLSVMPRIDAADCSENDAGNAHADCNQNGVPDRCEISAELRFESGFAYPLEDFAESIATEDFDGDGDIDILAKGPERTHGPLLLLRNRGDGTLGLPEELSPRHTARESEVADLDGDGDQDIVALGRLGLRTLWNTGDGTFEQELRSLDWVVPAGLGTGDFDGDGRVDLVLLRGAVYQVFLQRDARTFLELPEVRVKAHVDTVAVGDFDRDRQADLVMADFDSNELLIFFGNGDGVFSPPDTVLLSDRPIQLSIGDLDNNQRDDILVTSREGFSLALSLPGQNFLVTSIPLPGTRRVALGDLDKDGLVDLAVTAIGPLRNVAILFNLGDGSFVEQAQISLLPNALAMADIDSDGNLDLLAAENHSITIYRNDGQGRFAPGPRHLDWHPWLSSRQSAAAAHFDADGDLDVAFVAGSSTIDVVRNRGDGTFDRREPIQTACCLTSVVTGDFDGDGIGDLAVGDEVSVSTLLSEGPTFSNQVVSRVAEPMALASADVDGDGNDDLMVATSNPSGAMLLVSRGDGSYARHSRRYSGNPRSVAAADVDGDGKPEVIAGNTTRDVAIFRVAGDGALSEPERLEVGAAVRGTAVADLDGDGDIDVAVAESSGGVTILSNHGDGEFSPLQRVPLLDQPGDVATADLNQDGRPDLVTSNSTTITALLNVSGGTFLPRHLSSVGRAPFSVLLGDFDGDGAPDVLAPERLFLNVSEPPAGDENGDGILDSCQRPFVRGDCDGDGRIGGHVGDAIFLLNFAFLNGPAPGCLAACDADGDGTVAGTPTDAVYLLSFSFLNGPPPPPPFPACGRPQGEEPLVCPSSEACP